MRIKLMTANIDSIMINRILTHAVQHDYTEGDLDGYRVDSFTDSTIVGRYYFKREQVFTTIDPFGSELSYSTVTYDVTKFKISTTFPEITIYEPPRNLSVFFNSIAKGTEYSFTASAITVDVMKWALNIEKHMGSAIFKTIIASGVVLSNYVSGKFQIAGTQDVRDYVSVITSGKKCLIDKVKLSTPEFDCEMSKTGSVVVSSTDGNDFINVITKSVPFMATERTSLQHLCCYRT